MPYFNTALASAAVETIVARTHTHVVTHTVTHTHHCTHTHGNHHRCTESNDGPPTHGVYCLTQRTLTTFVAQPMPFCATLGGRLSVIEPLRSRMAGFRISLVTRQLSRRRKRRTCILPARTPDSSVYIYVFVWVYVCMCMHLRSYCALCPVVYVYVRIHLRMYCACVRSCRCWTSRTIRVW